MTIAVGAEIGIFATMAKHVAELTELQPWPGSGFFMSITAWLLTLFLPWISLSLSKKFGFSDRGRDKYQ
jgi:hypothetical protein